jgi:hypothetical protein
MQILYAYVVVVGSGGGLIGVIRIRILYACVVVVGGGALGVAIRKRNVGADGGADFYELESGF